MAAATGKKLKDTVPQASSHKESAAEIGDIFRSVKENKNKKRKELENHQSSNSNVRIKKKKNDDDKKGDFGEITANSNTKKQHKKKEEVKNKDERFPTEKNKRRRTTNDGLVIYSAEELGFGKSEAGGTPLCPFDCSCCF